MKDTVTSVSSIGSKKYKDLHSAVSVVDGFFPSSNTRDIGSSSINRMVIIIFICAVILFLALVYSVKHKDYKWKDDKEKPIVKTEIPEPKMIISQQHIYRGIIYRIRADSSEYIVADTENGVAITRHK